MAPGTRPSSGRLREALFSIWGERVVGARVLDSFAGSGAVGIEALSRGAGEVDFVEARPEALAVLRRNCALLVPGSFRVLRARLPDDLGRLVGEPFDLAFADPPYRFTEWGQLLAGLSSLLASGGEAAVEHSVRSELPDRAGSLERVDERRYGESQLSFYRRGS